jgi:hypothetical protein
VCTAYWLVSVSVLYCELCIPVSLIHCSAGRFLYCCHQLLEAQYDDTIGPIRDITQQPFWMPSQSLQLKMITHAHTLIEVLNQVRSAAVE